MSRLSEVRRLGRGGGTHRLDVDGRALILAAAAFILCVVSVPKFDLRGVLQLFAVPLFAVPALGLPVAPLLRRLALVSPLVLLLGAFNPFLDTRPMADAFPVPMSAGMASFLVITGKAVLSVVAIVLLTQLLSFEALGAGLKGLKVPEVFVVQLLFLHRYLFLLVEEAQTMRKARDLRSFGRRGLGLRVTAGLLGSLFLRTLDRSQRIFRCMVARGFDGAIRLPPARPFGPRDAAFLLGVALALAGLRLA